VALDQRATEELLWWRDQLRTWNGKDIIQYLIIETDASLIGWGAGSQDRRTLVPSGERPSMW